MLSAVLLLHHNSVQLQYPEHLLVRAMETAGERVGVNASKLHDWSDKVRVWYSQMNAGFFPPSEADAAEKSLHEKFAAVEKATVAIGGVHLEVINQVVNMSAQLKVLQETSKVLQETLVEIKLAQARMEIMLGSRGFRDVNTTSSEDTTLVSAATSASASEQTPPRKRQRQIPLPFATFAAGVTTSQQHPVWVKKKYSLASLFFSWYRDSLYRTLKPTVEGGDKDDISMQMKMARTVTYMKAFLRPSVGTEFRIAVMPSDPTQLNAWSTNLNVLSVRAEESIVKYINSTRNPASSRRIGNAWRSCHDQLHKHKSLLPEEYTSDIVVIDEVTPTQFMYANVLRMH